MEKFIHFTACGLTYDAVGVLLVGYAFFSKTKEAIILEAGTYFDLNPHALKSIISSKFDGISGTILLFIGFIYQVMGYTSLTNKNMVVGSYILLIVFLAIYFTNFRKRKINEWYKELYAKSTGKIS